MYMGGMGWYVDVIRKCIGEMGRYIGVTGRYTGETGNG